MPLLESTALTGGIITSLYEHLLKPRIDSQRLTAKRSRELQIALQRYLGNFYSKIHKVRTVVYNEPVEMQKIYYPLTLIERETGKSYEMNDNCHFIFSESKRLLVIDYAGMGKSTLSKHMFLRTCENQEFIPLFFELRRIKKDKGILDNLREDLGDVGEPAPATVVQDLFSLDGILFILDGFDEIPIELKDSASREIVDITTRFPNIVYVLTSRKDSLVDITSSFDYYHIGKLDRQDINNIIRKYDDKNIQADKIIEEINKIEDRSFHELLSNPMMVTLLFRSYSYNQEIPSKTYLFYEQVYKSLFNGHDLLKGYIREHKSKLDVHQLQNILCYIAVKSIKNGPSYEELEIKKLIEEGMKRFGYSSSGPSDVLDDLYQAVPLFSDEGNEVRWVHKSFQDYFAALYVSFTDQKQAKDVLEGIMKSPKSFQYANMVEMCYDMNPSLVEEFIFLPMAQSYLSYAINSRKGGVDKLVYDNIYMRGLVHIYRAEEKGYSFDHRKDWNSVARDLYDLIPSNGIKPKLQTVGSSYTATAEAANYWLFEMLLKKSKSFKAEAVSGRFRSTSLDDWEAKENGEILIGHSNILNIDEELRREAILALSEGPSRDSRTLERLYISIDEEMLNEYVQDIESRLRIAEIKAEF